MKRFCRWTLNAVTVLSLLLCAMTVALWRATASRAGASGYLRRQMLGEFEIGCCQGSIGWATLRREGYTAYAVAHHDTEWMRASRFGSWVFWRGRAYPADRRGGYAAPPFVFHETWSNWPPYLRVEDEYAAPAGFLGRRGRFGFDFARGRYHKEATQLGSPFDQDEPLITAGTVPLWAIFVLTALLPFVRGSQRVAVVWRGRRRRQANRCHACGYDLTSNVSGVCPECGTAVSARHYDP